MSTAMERARERWFNRNRETFNDAAREFIDAMEELDAELKALAEEMRNPSVEPATHDDSDDAA